MSWIFFTIAAVIFQTFRNLEQKALNKKLDALTVSWSRFILPLPFALLCAGYSFSSVGYHFIFYCFVTAVAQVAGNVCLLHAFKKNFSIGIAFYKTEVLQAMILGLLFFDETLSNYKIVAIIVTTFGAILMSGSFDSGVKNFVKSLNNNSMLFGLLCGFCFSISAFSLKFASQNLMLLGYSQIQGPVMVLMWVLCFQNIFFIIIKSAQKRLVGDFKMLFESENKSAFFRTTTLSFLGSICWFVAYALGKVVYVKAVGQLELLLAILFSYFFLKEKFKLTEFAGIVLTAFGITSLILVG